MNLDWHFQTIRQSGDSMANIATSAWRATGRKKTTDLIRESIQNSCDQIREDKEFARVKISLTTLKNEYSSEFRDWLKFNRATEEGFDLKWPSNMHVLVIEDFNTRGLDGPEHALSTEDENRGNFVRLCRNIGDTHIEAGRGGSHGIGKGVYWNYSQTGIVLFYSRFMPTEHTENNEFRFIGSGMFEDQGNYNGRAFFADLQEKDQNEIYPSPLVDARAREVVKDKLDYLGVSERSEPEDTGTSIILVGAPLENPQEVMNDIRAAFEKHYWPRIHTGRLKVQLQLNGEYLEPPDIESRPDLRPYIQAYNLVREKKESGELDTDDFSYVENLSYKNYNLGTVGILRLNDSHEVDDPLLVSTNRVSLFRQPGMVIEYRDYRRPIPYAAVFEASEEIDEILAKSEPQGHDKWDHESKEFRDSKDESAVVYNTWVKVQTAIREYLREYEHDPHEQQECPDLSRELANIIPLNPGRGGSGRKMRPVSIQFTREPSIALDNGDVQIQTTVRLEPLADLIGEQKGDMVVLIKPIIQADDGVSSGDELELERVLLDGQPKEFSDDKELTIELDPEKYDSVRPYELEIYSEKINDMDLAIDFQVRVDFVERKAEET